MALIYNSIIIAGDDTLKSMIYAEGASFSATRSVAITAVGDRSCFARCR